MKPETVSHNLVHPRPHINAPHITAQTAERQEIVAEDSGNPTVLPTQFLRGVTPIFLIRHPALVFESILRVSGPTMGAQVDDDEFPIDASLRWQRVLHDWFTNSGMHPIVLNADEIIARPAIVQQLCEQLQLNPTGVRFGWDRVAPSIIAQQSAYQQQFFSTIQSSCGVQLDKHSAAQGLELNLDDMTIKWGDVYGLETAAALRSFVDAAMPDYEYLCHHELQM
jgi:hypothetical protein